MCNYDIGEAQRKCNEIFRLDELHLDVQMIDSGLVGKYEETDQFTKKPTC